MAHEAKSVIVVGAGIVGVATAIWLQRAGHTVTLIDRDGPAAGTSYGNAGILASSSVVPVTVPGLIGNIPKYLFNPDSPMFMRWRYLPKLLPWLIRYLRQANADDVAHIAKAMTPILFDSAEQHLALANGTGAEKYITTGTYIYGYQDKAAYEADSVAWNLRKANGFNWEELDAAAFDAIEPVFEGHIGYGIKLSDHGYISDPGNYVKALADHFIQQGGTFLQAELVDVETVNSQLVSVITNTQTIHCDEMVLATGVWSGPLAKKLGVHMPIEAERGYHIELVNPNKTPNHPVMIASGKFVATPMDGRLRCAGIVEFGGLDAPPSRKPFELLKTQIHALIPGLKYDRIDEWMGARPAPIDSIPSIGPFATIKGAHAAFGHQHVGLTGGPKTGRIVADIISGRKPNLDLEPYRVSRFTE